MATFPPLLQCTINLHTEVHTPAHMLVGALEPTVHYLQVSIWKSALSIKGPVVSEVDGEKNKQYGEPGLKSDF